MIDPDNVIISYTVKELLATLQKEQVAGFERLAASLETKADRAEVTRIEETIKQHGREIGDLQAWKHDTLTSGAAQRRHDDKTRGSRDRWISIIKWTIGSIVAVLGPYLGTHPPF